jgi:hypothetical protein
VARFWKPLDRFSLLWLAMGVLSKSMAKLRLDFNKSDGSFSSLTYAHISLAGWSKDREDGPPLLSAQCVTAKQVEEAADYLKKQLDEIVAKAKIKFEAAKKKGN